MDLRATSTLTLEQLWISIFISVLISTGKCGKVRNQRLGCFAEQGSPSVAIFCPDGQYLRIVSSKFGLSRFRLCFRIIHDCVEEGPSLEGCCGRQSCEFTINRRHLETCGGGSSYYQVLYECVDYVQDAGCLTTTASTASLPDTTTVPTRPWPTTAPHPFTKFIPTNRSTVRVTVSSFSNTPRHRTSIAKIIEFLSTIVNRNSTQPQGPLLSNITTTPAPPVRVTNVPPFWNTFLKTTSLSSRDEQARTEERTIYTAYPARTTTPFLRIYPTQESHTTKTEDKHDSEGDKIVGQSLTQVSTVSTAVSRDTSLLDFWRGLLSQKTTVTLSTSTTPDMDKEKLTQSLFESVNKQTPDADFPNQNVNDLAMSSTQSTTTDVPNTTLGSYSSEPIYLTEVYSLTTDELTTAPIGTITPRFITIVPSFKTTSRSPDVTPSLDIKASTPTLPTSASKSISSRISATLPVSAEGQYVSLQEEKIDALATSVVPLYVEMTHSSPTTVSALPILSQSSPPTVLPQATLAKIRPTTAPAQSILTQSSPTTILPQATLTKIQPTTVQAQPILTQSRPTTVPARPILTQSSHTTVSAQHILRQSNSSTTSAQLVLTSEVSQTTSSKQPNLTQNRFPQAIRVLNNSDNLDTAEVQKESGKQLLGETPSQIATTTSESPLVSSPNFQTMGNKIKILTTNTTPGNRVTTDANENIYFETPNDILEEDDVDDYQFVNSEEETDSDDIDVIAEDIPKPCGQVADEEKRQSEMSPESSNIAVKCFNPEHGESTSYSQNTLIGIACAEALVFLALMLVLMLYLRRRYLAKSAKWAERQKRGFSFGSLIRPVKPFEDRFDPENGCTVLDDCPPVEKQITTVRPVYNDNIFRFEPDWDKNDQLEKISSEAVIKNSDDPKTVSKATTKTKPKAPKPPRRTSSQEPGKSSPTISEGNSGIDSGVITDHEDSMEHDEEVPTGQSKGQFNNVMMELLQTIPLKDEYVVRSNHRHQFGIREPPQISNNDFNSDKQRIRKPPRTRQHSAPQSNQALDSGEGKTYSDNDIDDGERFYEDKKHKTTHKTFEELQTTKEQFENMVNKLFDKVDEPPYINTVIENGRVKIMEETSEKSTKSRRQTQNVKFKDQEPTSTANGALKEILDTKRNKMVKSCLKSNKYDQNAQNDVIDGYAASNAADDAQYRHLKVPSTNSLTQTQEPRFVVNIYGSSESLDSHCQRNGGRNCSKTKRSKNRDDKSDNKLSSKQNTELVHYPCGINDSKRTLKNQALTML